MGSHSYVIEYRTKADFHWKEYERPPLFAGWTARRTTFGTKQEADDACRELSKLGEPRGEFHRVVRVRPPSPAIPAPWKRKLGSMPIDKAIEEISTKLAALDKKREALAAVRQDLLSRTKVRCTTTYSRKGCGKEAEIRDLVYIQTHWYVPPSGCSDGDYWRSGEGQYECPHCGHLNRLHDRPEIVSLSSMFRGITDTHDERGY